jgi:hypothetical protein
MNRIHLISNSKITCGEVLEASLILTFAFFLVNSGKQTIQPYGHIAQPQVVKPMVCQPNVHDIYYKANNNRLEKRFPFRRHNDPLAYIRQVFFVFGGATLMVLAFMKLYRKKKPFAEVAGWDVSLVCCTFNLIFAYAFGFVAVVNDWWFFFPDLITSHIWQIQKGQMVLGDVLFYPMATIMGYATIIFVTRIQSPIRSRQLDLLLKAVWYIIAMTVIFFGITFGSTVMKGMISWLYIPFGIAGLVFYKKYTGVELWTVTSIFLVCEFAWDAVARIKGIWIFPDASTHPGLYIKEILVCTIGKYPLVWQPEMTQMAFMSGMISLVFFHLARYLLNKSDIIRT